MINLARWRNPFHTAYHTTALEETQQDNSNGSSNYNDHNLYRINNIAETIRDKLFLQQSSFSFSTTVLAIMFLYFVIYVPFLLLLVSLLDSVIYLLLHQRTRAVCERRAQPQLHCVIRATSAYVAWEYEVVDTHTNTHTHTHTLMRAR